MIFILDLGARMVSTKAVDFKEEHERQLQQVADEAEERATRELRAALKRLREEKDAERAKALKNQKEVCMNSLTITTYYVAPDKTVFFST